MIMPSPPDSQPSQSRFQQAQPPPSDVLPLPKGALSVPPPTAAFVNRSADPQYSPPSTPSQPLLDSEPSSDVQFATYQNSTPKVHAQALPGLDNTTDSGWVPWPLRPFFWISFVVILVLGAIGLEVALHFSNKNQGWPAMKDTGSETGVLHYVYTLPPVAVAAMLAAFWTWTDFEIKKMQPYIDLVHGDSPPHRSLLLDYTRINNFVVWTSAASNRHYLVALTSLMVLLSLLFQPLSAALLVVKDTYLPLPDVTLNNTGAIGLNQDLQFQDATTFVTAAGFASASVLYNLPDPSFIHESYTIAPFQLPRDIAPNGTVIANTTAVKSESNCHPVPVVMKQRIDRSGWNNSASFGSCNISWSVDKSAINLFGVNSTFCNPVQDPWFRPIVFWFFTYKPNATASATFCFPNISLWDVNVNVDLATRNLTKVLELRPFSSPSSNFSSLSGNVTGDPLFGRAYNGVEFNSTNATDPSVLSHNTTDPFVLDRRNATRIQLPAAVFQAAVQSPQGLIGSFDSGKFVDLSTSVYQTYLNLIARNVYFIPHNESLTVQVKTFQSRVWLSSVATHILAASMLLLALCAGIVHIFHRVERGRLRLRHEPGTIASAVSIGAQTGMGELLAGRQGQEEIKEVLSNKKFRIDPRTMKIIMEGEEGYESAASPMNRRRSVFAALQSQGLLGGRLSAWSNQRQPSLPNSPRRKDDV